MVDDSLLSEVMANGGITPAIISRMCGYFKNMEDLGVDLIFNQCSSVGEAADIASILVSIPLVKVDQAMADEAAEQGSKIGVIVTVASTMEPSVNLVKASMKSAGKGVAVTPYLVDGALDILMKEGNREKHNQLVLAEIEKAQTSCDAIVLSQGSMAMLEPFLDQFSVPVLTSPERGVLSVRKYLLEL